MIGNQIKELFVNDLIRPEELVSFGYSFNQEVFEGSITDYIRHSVPGKEDYSGTIVALVVDTIVT